MYSNKKIVGFSFLLLFLSCFMVQSATLKLGKTKKFKSLGISFKMFHGFEGRPINFPDLFSFKNTKQKGYKNIDIWRYKQYVGSWGNSDAELNVYEMSFAPPRNFSGYITEEEASKKYEESSTTVSWDKDEKRKWLELFTGRKIGEKVHPIKNKYGTKIELYSIKNKNGFLGLFVASNKELFEKNIVFLYSVNSTIPKKQAKNLVYSSIKSTCFTRVAKKTETDTKKNLKNSNPDYEASKEKVIRNIKNLKNWWGISSKDYFIITNYPKSSKKFIKQIKAELISSQNLYSRYYKRIVPLKEINVVRVFNDRESYVAYVGDDKKWTGGLWLPSKKELVISPNTSVNEKGNKNSQIRILRHEAFHQYIHFALDQIQTSVWFNEGSAIFFASIVKKGRTLKVKPSTYLKRLKNMIKKQKPDITTLLKMDYEQFYSGNGSKEKVSENYALAWGIVYFLQKGAYTVKRKTGRNYTKILKNYYKQLVETKSSEEATKLAWEKINMKTFTEDFVKYYNSL